MQVAELQRGGRCVHNRTVRAEPLPFIVKTPRAGHEFQLPDSMRAVGVNDFGRNATLMLNLDEPALDWVAMARGMGVEAARATTAEEFTKLFKGALGRKGLFLIEAVI